MSSEMGNVGHLAKYIRDAEENGIEILQPSVNDSEKKFTCEDGKIRYGLQAVKNVGEAAIDNIVEARERNGKPKNIFEFVNGIDVGLVNKKAMESLIKAGALDCFSRNRAAHLAVYESLMESAQNDAKKNIAGQVSLFNMDGLNIDTGDASGKLPDVANFDDKTLLAMEKEMLGVYITGHPLKEYEQKMSRLATVTSRELAASVSGEEEDEDGAFNESGYSENANQDIYDGKDVVICGMITGKKNLVTKSSKMMAFVDIEDLYGVMETVVFPNVYERCQEVLNEDEVVAMKGRLNFKEGEMPKVLADNVMRIDDPEIETLTKGGSYGSYGSQRAPGSERDDVPASRESEDFGYVQPVKVRIPQESEETEVLERLKEVFAIYPGVTPVYIYLKSGRTIRTGNGAGVRPSADLLSDLGDIVGNANVKFAGRVVF